MSRDKTIRRDISICRLCPHFENGPDDKVWCNALDRFVTHPDVFVHMHTVRPVDTFGNTVKCRFLEYQAWTLNHERSQHPWRSCRICTKCQYFRSEARVQRSDPRLWTCSVGKQDVTVRMHTWRWLTVPTKCIYYMEQVVLCQSQKQSV